MIDKFVDLIKSGKVGIIPTDTIYGIVGSALSPDVVARIIKIKKRSDSKGPIVLISSVKDLSLFDVQVSDRAKIFLQKFWPGKVSIIFPSGSHNFNYLIKNGGIAFRVPNKPDLLELLSEAGPLVAPSANPEGMLPAKNIEEAKKYFGDEVDFYIDGGTQDSFPSTVVKIVENKISVIRQGAVQILPEEI